ncbi:hypothetical protein L1987_16546 [Smallanthus sonchifolius]|uniref:Uncharacterized protein n=1 Tax=Smallanthus sonchifolius TaxID=185202 RepID=A0ACB9JAV7_9ASTR|nr:hypothetical protein L1987_16546 [Smallanthus sonchifolius]
MQPGSRFVHLEVIGQLCKIATLLNVDLSPPPPPPPPLRCLANRPSSIVSHLCTLNSLTLENQMSSDIEKSSLTKPESKWYSGLVQQVSVYGIAVGYRLSASLLSIINKWAVMKFPYPGALTALQYFTSAAGVLFFGYFELLEHDL